MCSTLKATQHMQHVTSFLDSLGEHSYDVSKFWFHLQTDLVLFSRNQNKHLMKISCGGGHRSYGFTSKQQVEIPTGNILRSLTICM